MLRLAVQLSSDWRRFGTCLGFEWYTLDTINADNYSAGERGLAVINRWKQGCPNPGSYDKYAELTGALTEIGRKDIAENVRREYEYVTTSQNVSDCIFHRDTLQQLLVVDNSPSPKGIEANKTYIFV